MSSRITVQDGPYAIHALKVQGRFRARAFLKSRSVADGVGVSAEAAINDCRNQIETTRAERLANRREGIPTAAEYLDALACFEDRISTAQRAMLVWHAAAPERRATMKELAVAARYAGRDSAYLKYGEVGRWIGDLLSFPYATRPDGTPIKISSLAEGSGEGPEQEWVWVMHVELAEAVKLAGLLQESLAVTADHR
ncbi:MAG TPA: hypothetical protein VFG43_03330 [Geminicoccaceae bacterium]|nr:hypothetical protein [Geminicoccaceae bacterium]